MSKSQPSLFEGARMSMQDSIDLTAQSLMAYGAEYRHWAVAFSGGKDSSTVATVVTALIEAGRIEPPETLTFLYADTRLELMPLWYSAMRILEAMKRRGYKTQVVLPALDDRFFVYMFGRGVPPPSNTFRWCTPQMKIEPMLAALKTLRDQTGEKFLMLTRLRLENAQLAEQAAKAQRAEDALFLANQEISHLRAALSAIANRQPAIIDGEAWSMNVSDAVKIAKEALKGSEI